MESLHSVILDPDNSEIPSIYDCHKKKFNCIKNKLIIIKDIKINDKLGCDEDNILYIDKYQWGQYFRRVWYNQSRKKTEQFLHQAFIEMIQFLDKYLVFLDVTPKFIVKILDPRYKDLTDEICKFINDIIVGLYNLKKTYPDYKELKCRVDSIIMTLVDFKDKSQSHLTLAIYSPINIRERALSF